MYLSSVVGRNLKHTPCYYLKSKGDSFHSSFQKIFVPDLFNGKIKLFGRSYHSNALTSATSSYCKNFQSKFSKRNISTVIIGAGPSGFYSAKFLAQTLNKFKEENPSLISKNSTITLLDRFPTPFGLVRYGVAPDHPEVKNVTKEFERILENENTYFIGNVTVGKDVSVEELREMFDCIILCYGADNERKLRLENEDLIESARDFIHFYNGLPNGEKRAHLKDKYRKLLGDAKKVVVIGQGNVALDVSRMLAKSIDELKEYDVTEEALDVLKDCSVSHIDIVGRRGPVQAACTTKELRELTKLKESQLYIDPKDLILDDISKNELEKAGRVKKRMIEAMSKCDAKDDKLCTVQFRFFLSPVEILKKENGKLLGIKFEKNILIQDELTGRVESKGTGEYEIIECDVAFRSIGYKGSVIPGVPFDDFRGVVPNKLGRVNIPESNKSICTNHVYVSGWLKRGPTGVILMNIVDSQETVGSIEEDILSGKFSDLQMTRHSLPQYEKNGHNQLIEHLTKRNVQFVTYEDYQILEKFEEEQGKMKSKLREKVLSVEKMLKIINELKNPSTS